MNAVTHRLKGWWGLVTGLSTFEKVAMILLIGFGSYLRFHAIGDWVIAGDDVLHLEFAVRRNLWESFLFVTRAEMHPALSYLMLYGLVTYVSAAPEVLRLVTEVPSFFLMPGMYVLGRVLIGRRAGLFLLGMAAMSPTLIVQSQDFRGYAMSQLFMLCGMVSASYYLQQGQPKWRRYYYGWMALALFSEYASAEAVGTIGLVLVYLMWERARRKFTPEILWFIGGHALLAIFWGAQLYYYFHDGWPGEMALGHTVHGRITSFGSALSLTGEVLAGFLTVWPNPCYMALIVMFVGGLGLMVYCRERFLPLLVAVAFVVAVAGSILKLYPMMATRHSMWLMLFLSLPPAYLVEYVARFYGKRRLVLGALWLLVAVVVMSNGIFLGRQYLAPEIYRQPDQYKLVTELELKTKDFHGAVEFLKTIQKPDLLLLSLSEHLRILYWKKYDKLYPDFDLDSPIVCWGWHIAFSSHIDNCIQRLFDVPQVWNESKYREEVQHLEAIRASRDVYVVTHYLPDIFNRRDLMDTSKPAYVSSTVMAFALPEGKRQWMIHLGEQQLERFARLNTTGRWPMSMLPRAAPGPTP
jgi:hypothetical protein